MNVEPANMYNSETEFRNKEAFFLMNPTTTKTQFTTAVPGYWCVHKVASPLLCTFHPLNPKYTFH
jgi:hypothetical protein